MIERTYKVLVVDDDESVRESLRKLLLGEGYQVIAVANGAEVGETLFREQEQIDLLLVDLNMPLKSGRAMLERLFKVNPSLPAVIVTGQPNQYELAQAAGVSALVEKPIDVPAFLELIQKLLAGPIESRRQCTGSIASGNSGAVTRREQHTPGAPLFNVKNQRNT
jgi:two-component system response regulator TtrR